MSLSEIQDVHHYKTTLTKDPMGNIFLHFSTMKCLNRLATNLEIDFFCDHSHRATDISCLKTCEMGDLTYLGIIYTVFQMGQVVKLI